MPIAIRSDADNDPGRMSITIPTGNRWEAIDSPTRLEDGIGQYMDRNARPEREESS